MLHAVAGQERGGGLGDVEGLDFAPHGEVDAVVGPFLDEGLDSLPF